MNNKKAKMAKKKRFPIKPVDIGNFRLFPLLKTIGFLFHVPAIMALFSLIICLIYAEYYACFCLVIFAFLLCLVGQFLYRVFAQYNIRSLWEAMLSAALGWAICSFVGAFPYFFIASKLSSLGLSNESIDVFRSLLNCNFESFSGFTSTGLTMVARPSLLPHILQFWRSSQSWIGGMGLLAFVIALVESKREEYRFYLAEAKSDMVGNNLRTMLLKIWFIYFIFTVVIAFLFYLAKMPIWDAINHSMTAIATGGFSISDNSLEGYSVSAQAVALLGMTLGCMSFSLHYQIFREGRILKFWQNIQNRLLFIFLIIGSLVIILLTFISMDPESVFTCIFSFFTSLSTCGFRTTNMDFFTSAVKLFLILAMISGASSGSTSGGIKIRRIKNVFSAFLLRCRRITSKHEKEIIEGLGKKGEEKEIVDIDLPKSEQTSRLYAASVLFISWLFCLALSWFVILVISPHFKPLNVLFDVTSALGNVGLSTGVVQPTLPIISKIIFIFLMWLGRLEIIPVIILISTFFAFFKKNKKKK